MGRLVIPQPDGKFSLYSTIVDEFIGEDMTEKEVVAYFVKRAAADARRDAKDLMAQVHALMAGQPWTRAPHFHAAQWQALRKILARKWK